MIYELIVHFRQLTWNQALILTEPVFHCRYMSTLYSHPDFPEKGPKEINEELMNSVSHSPLLLLTPQKVKRYIEALWNKKSSGQPVTFTDIFGMLIGETLIHNVSSWFLWLLELWNYCVTTAVRVGFFQMTLVTLNKAHLAVGIFKVTGEQILGRKIVKHFPCSGMCFWMGLISLRARKTFCLLCSRNNPGVCSKLFAFCGIHWRYCSNNFHKKWDSGVTSLCTFCYKKVALAKKYQFQSKKSPSLFTISWVFWEVRQ